MAWIRHDQTFRQQYLLTLLQHVRLPFLTVRFITDICDNEVRRTSIASSTVPIVCSIIVAIDPIVTQVSRFTRRGQTIPSET